jgi:hypothetical protein
MGVLIPSLGAARKAGQGAVCLSNVRQLSTAWTVYSDDNGGRIVGSQVLADQWVADNWVHRRAQNGDPGFVPGMSGHDTELAGIKTGALYKYVNTTAVYHCVADPSWRKNKSKTPLAATESPYRSYAIQDGLNGTGYFSQTPLRRMNALKRTSEIYVFLEEDEGQSSHNWGSWILDKKGNSFWDPISIWHRKGSTLGYADGHSELHLWVDKTTWLVSSGELPPGTPMTDSADLIYMQKGYVVAGQ